MIVVMKTGATEAQVLGVQKQIRELGFRDHRIHGEERNVVAVLGHVYPELADELTRLRRENARLQEERDILKKAMAFFAKESS